MPIPSGAFAWKHKLDPSDLDVFEIDLTGTGGLLAEGESISSFTLTLLPEAVALGLIVNQDVGRAPALINTNTGLRIWFEIAVADRGNSAFTTGAKLPMELEIITNSNPSRRLQRTLVLEAIHK